MFYYSNEYFIQLLEFVDLYKAESKLDDTGNINVPTTITTNNGTTFNQLRGEY